MKNIVFVCMGNICRSPLAEGFARARLAQAGLVHAVALDSAGTGDWHAGEPPDPRAIAVARARGVDIAELRARQIRAADFMQSDLILCADRDNLAELRRRMPVATRAECALLLEWTGLGTGRELPDPYYGSAADFEHVADLAEQAAQGLLARLRLGA